MISSHARRKKVAIAKALLAMSLIVILATPRFDLSLLPGTAATVETSSLTARD